MECRRKNASKQHPAMVSELDTVRSLYLRGIQKIFREVARIRRNMRPFL